MPLTIEYNHAVCPIIVCDACGKKIVAASEGNYEWDSEADTPILYFSHKACTARLRARHGEVDSWGPLTALPAFLVGNLRMTWEESEESMEFMEGM